MNQEQRQRMIKWCEALENGKYPQSKHALRTEYGFCCLGVASDLYDSSKWTIDNTYELDGCYSRHSLTLPVINFYGIDLNQISQLMIMNDGGKSFKEIAAYIREEILYE